MDDATIEGADAVTIKLIDADTVIYRCEPSGTDIRGEVVFCHGTPWSAAVWARVAHAINENYRCFLWDMPGYGASAKGTGIAVDIPAQARRLARLLDHYGLDHPHLVAHDIGGAVALHTHLLLGVDYASLYLWDPVILGPWGSDFFRVVTEHRYAFEELPPDLHAALVTAYISGAAAHPLTSDWLSTLSTPWLGGAGQRAFYHQIASLCSEQTDPLVDALKYIRCRTAIGWGADDPWLPARQAQELQDLIPGPPPVTLIEGVGHLGPVEATAEVSTAITQWLASP